MRFLLFLLVLLGLIVWGGARLRELAAAGAVPVGYGAGGRLP